MSANPPEHANSAVTIPVPDAGSVPDTDHNFKHRLLRGHEKLKRAHWEQLEKYLPVLPGYKLSSSVSKKPVIHVNNDGVINLGAYLPKGMDKFVHPISNDKNEIEPVNSKVEKIPKMKALKMNAITTSATARKLVGAPPEPPSQKLKAASFSRSKHPSETVAAKDPTPIMPTTQPVVDIEVLKQLYSSGHSTPSERIGSFYSIDVGTLSPIRLYMNELLSRRQRKGVGIVKQPGTKPPPLIKSVQLDESAIKINCASKQEGYLPLELFDTEAERKRGKAFILQHDRDTNYVKWLPCQVVRRDPATLYYEVSYSQLVGPPPQTEPKSISRLVSRYQLRFPDEDPEQFSNRILDLKRQRKKAEQELRTELLISLMQDDDERGLPESTQAAILERSAKRMPASWKHRITQYMNQVCEEHLYSIRKVRLQYYSLSPTFRLQLLPLQA
eukprot:TRINITY_DN17201_c0_g1_i1.p1 TRINITY_DN17201_c0_g1~~TRINITY_DN17201_c0_g1_i1.p1  ORF type:complete len:443 (+),score=54.76 TRINITY_DN17201_c0_g1_i1:117-1445(+)